MSLTDTKFEWMQILEKIAELLSKQNATGLDFLKGQSTYPKEKQQVYKEKARLY